MRDSKEPENRMSLFKTIRKTLVPIHPEGHKFIIAFFAVSLILGFLWMPLFWVGMVLTLWCAYFFRDPERSVPQEDDYAISPADGTVSMVAMVVPPAELALSPEPMLKVSIFMNVFDCHVNRAPMRGTVEHVVLVSGHGRVGPVDAPYELHPGDYLSYAGDAPHVFEALTPGTSAVLVSESR